MGPLEQQARDDFRARRQRMWAAGKVEAAKVVLPTTPSCPFEDVITINGKVPTRASLEKWARKFLDWPPSNVPTINYIKRLVAHEYKVEVIDIDSDRRSVTVVVPRQVAMYLARKHTRHSLPEIGRRFGDKDHSTVHHAVSKVERLRLSDASFNAKVSGIEAHFLPNQATGLDRLNAPAGDEG